MPVSLEAQQVLSVTWPTRIAAEPLAVSPEQRQWLPILQSAFASAPEESIIAFGLAQGSSVGLSSSDASRLQILFSNYYARVRKSPIFNTSPAALPYCLSPQKPTNGLATVYVPARVTSDTRQIVFLHGFGGSLLAYCHFLANTFSNDVIICPAYGLAPANIPAAYVAEAQTAVHARLPALKKKPALIGLSAGGVGACRVDARNSDAFERLICLGTIPPADAMAKFASPLNATFISGGTEPNVANGSFELQMKEMNRRVQGIRWGTIPRADHYFLLSHDKETRVALVEAMNR